MLVSIITVCFNSENFIKQTIESVVNQTYKSIEYIIIDGKSSDNTLNIIEEFATLYPKNIKYISESDTGIYDAMNKGLKMAKGELVGIINSDDWYELNAVETIVDSFKKNGVAVYHGIQRTYRDNQLIRLIGTSSSQLDKQMIEHPTCFIPKVIYDKIGNFNDEYKFVGDYELMLRMKKEGIPFFFVESIIANFREGGASHKPSAVYETYKLWLNLGMLSKQEYTYRMTMDRLRFKIRKTF